MQSGVPDLPLRDIHLPEPISWWPPAPGWWILAIITIAVTWLIIRWLVRRQRKMAAYKSAIQTLANIQSDFLSHQDKEQLVQDLSSLLRRVAITITSRESAACLTGHRWLEYLDSMAGQPLFNTDDGRIIVEAPYKPANNIDPDVLIKLCHHWLTAINFRSGRDGIKRGNGAYKPVHEYSDFNSNKEISEKGGSHA